MNRKCRTLLHSLGFIATVFVFNTALFVGLQVNVKAANTMLWLGAVMLILNFVALGVKNVRVKKTAGLILLVIFVGVAGYLFQIMSPLPGN